ncbi:2942_t:CDS:2 [Funneliformis caledonium]|uniref:2942_t:CDS:1 n=1 Tax=Funneliformis caledonium TaxID=1117310 RepID=A0A9N9D8U8_9GLOM|nr:2942_t:CDS:2 [Funneliformis caledonium]
MGNLVNNFTVVCTEIDGIQKCACDFRVNFYGCPFESLLKKAALVLIPLCLFSLALSCGMLYYYIKVRNQSFSLPATRDRGILRFRPFQTFHLYCVAYILFETIHLIMLVTDSYRSLVIAEIGFAAMHTFASAIGMLYPISVVYSTPTSIHMKYKSELTNPRLLDILGFGMIGYSFICFNTFAVLTGIAGENMDIEKADKYFALNSFFWVAWTSIFTCYLVFTWLKLRRIIHRHIKSLELQKVVGDTVSQQIINMRKASRNVNVPVVIMTICCLMIITSNIAVAISYRTVAIFEKFSSISIFAACKLKFYAKATITGCLSNGEIVCFNTNETNNTSNTYVDNSNNRESSLCTNNNLVISTSDNRDQIPSYENISRYPIAIHCTEETITEIQ